MNGKYKTGIIARHNQTCSAGHRSSPGKALNREFWSSGYPAIPGSDRRTPAFEKVFGGWIRHLQFLWILSLFQVNTVANNLEEPPPSVPNAETIIARMIQARAENRDRFRTYVVTRDYTFWGKEKQKPKSQVIVDVAFTPPDSKNYTIQRTNGSKLGERVIRRMLETEKEVAINKGITDISAGNYKFRYLAEEEWSGRRCYVMELSPGRKETHLLHSRIGVDADTFLLHRLEGEPSKSPSWWLKEVRIVFLFGEVDGMWLQTYTESSAHVRILGRYTVVSKDSKYQMGELTVVNLHSLP